MVSRTPIGSLRRNTASLAFLGATLTVGCASSGSRTFGLGDESDGGAIGDTGGATGHAFAVTSGTVAKTGGAPAVASGSAVKMGGTTAAAGAIAATTGDVAAVTGGAAAATGGAAAATGDVAAVTGGAAAVTGGAAAATGGTAAATGGVAAATGGAAAATGGTATATGGVAAAAGDVAAATGGAAAATGGTAAATGGVAAAAGGAAGSAGTAGASGTGGGAVVVVCPEPVAPDNGDVSSTSVQVGGKVTYTCSTGYGPPTPSTRTCQADGTWSGANPTCDLVDCGQPAAPADGSVEAPITTYDAEATYSCASDHDLVGDAVRSCQAKGAWSGEVPTCRCLLTMCDGSCVDLETDNRNCGECGNTCSAASPSTAECTPTGCLVTLAISEDRAKDVVVDSTTVYWVDNSNVIRIPLGGGESTTLASDQSFADDIAVDATNVYWAAHNDETVMKAPIAGGQPVALATGQNGPGGVAVNATDLYYVCNRGVVRVPLAGGSSTVIASSPAFSFDQDLVLDATNVYWRRDGLSETTSDKIMKQSLQAGSTPTTLATPSSIGSIAADATHVYWTMPEGGIAGAGKVARVPIAGGTTTILASGLDFPSGLAVDGTHVYVTCWGSGTVMKVPVAGGTPTLLASGQSGVGGVAVDTTSVYWVRASGPVMRLTPK